MSSWLIDWWLIIVEEKSWLAIFEMLTFCYLLKVQTQDRRLLFSSLPVCSCCMCMCVFSLLVLLNFSFSRSVDWYKGSLMPGRKMTEYSELCIGLPYRRCIVMDQISVCNWSRLLFLQAAFATLKNLWHINNLNSTVKIHQITFFLHEGDLNKQNRF